MAAAVHRFVSAFRDLFRNEVPILRCAGRTPSRTVAALLAFVLPASGCASADGGPRPSAPSVETFDELRSRLHRPKFDGYADREGRALYLAQLEAVSEWVSIAGAKLGCRDPDDDKVLETALMGEADCLITGDRDLLEMSPFHGIPILTPAAFLDLWTLR